MTATFYVRLEDGVDVRRAILETSKGAIHCLRAHQDITRLRGEKAALMDRARKELRELTLLLNGLEKMLPALSEKELAALRPAQEPALPVDNAQGRGGKIAVKPAKGGKSGALAPARGGAVETEVERITEDLATRLARIERSLQSL